MSAEIIHGEKVYSGDMIKSINIVQEYDPVTINLIQSTVSAKLTLEDETNVDFSNEEPLYIFHNGRFYMVGYIDTWQRETKIDYSLNMLDCVGKLEKTTFEGDLYESSDSVTAYNLIQNISEKANVPFVIAEEFKDIKIIGFIKYGNCREALNDILLYCGGYLNPCAVYNENTRTAHFNIALFDDTDEATEVPPKRVLQNCRLTTEEKITTFEIETHRYEFDEDTPTEVVFSPDNAHGTDVIVEMEKPIYRYEWSSQPSGIMNITNKSASYIEVTYSGNLYFDKLKRQKVTGLPYAHWDSTIVSQNGDTGKTASTELYLTATQEMADRCLDWVSRNKILKTKIVEGKTEQDDGTIIDDSPITVGMKVTVPTDFEETYTGRITRQSFNLNGNIIIKDTEIVIKE